MVRPPPPGVLGSWGQERQGAEAGQVQGAWLLGVHILGGVGVAQLERSQLVSSLTLPPRQPAQAPIVLSA